MGAIRKRGRRQGFSTGEAAEFCLVTAETILNWIRSGRLQAQRTAGGQYRIRAADLKLFMSENGMDTRALEEDRRFRPHCWEFYGQLSERFGRASLEVCAGCLVRRSGTRNCWELHGLLPLTACRHTRCEECDYYARYHTETAPQTTAPTEERP